MCSQNFLVWLITKGLFLNCVSLHARLRHEVTKRTEKRGAYRQANYERVQRYRVSINRNLKPYRN